MGPTNVKVRPATDLDLPGIAKIHVQSWRDAYRHMLPAVFLGDPIERVLSRHWQKTDLRDNGLVLVAEADELAGFIAVWCRPAPYIDNLHVRPLSRSKKIGSRLMKKAAEALLRKGHRTAYLWVFESNWKAIRFYERLGGVPAEKTTQDIFGYKIPSLKIEWKDISTLVSV